MTSANISKDEVAGIVRRIAGNLHTDYCEVPQDVHLAKNQDGKVRCGDNGMLMDYKGDVTVKIDGIAASAASVIAMAGTKVLMAPTALMMIHNPATAAFGDHEDMQKAIEMLSEVKESIINAYEIKTGLSRAKLSHLMDAETWMNAHKAMEIGFSDGVLEDEKKFVAPEEAYAFSSKAVATALMNKIVGKAKSEPAEPAKPEGRSVDELKERLATIKKYM